MTDTKQPSTKLEKVTAGVRHRLNMYQPMLDMLKGIQHLCDCQNSNIDGLSELIAKAEGEL